MKLSTKITVNAPAAKIWSVLVEDHMAVDSWMASIDQTRPLPDAKGAELARIAEIGAGAPGAWLEETATNIDAQSYKITIASVLPGVPGIAPLKGYTSDIQIREISADQCDVTWNSDASLKLHGMPFYWLMKKSLTSGFFRGLEELKHFVETGKPHPRKQKAFDRLAPAA